MSEFLVQSESLTAIAEAIRGKTGKEEGLLLSQMPDEILNIETGVDTTDATATAADILQGKTAYANEEKIEGAIPTKTANDLSVNGATVTVPAGYYEAQATKSVATAEVATPVISVSPNGKISANIEQGEGYVSGGVTSSVYLLDTQGAQTITPGTSNKTIASGKYLTGTQTIAGDADLKAANIKNGVNIFGVTGSYIGLGFTVVNGTSQPTNPADRTIWVNTSTAISGWDFCSTKPCYRSNNKNLLCYPYYHTTMTVNGITFTDNKNGKITVNGTATDEARFRPFHTTIESGLIWLEPGTYTVSGCPSGGSTSTYYWQVYDNDNAKTLANDVGSGKTFTITSGTHVRGSIIIKSGVTLTNAVFSPQIEKGSSVTSFVKGDATGQVWFETGTNSPGDFNALIANNIAVYPNHAEQFINGAWVPKEAYIYENSAWTQFAFTILWLYRNGDRNIGVTGDYWRDSPTSGTAINDKTTTDGITYLDLPNRGDSSGLYKAYTIYTGKMIDLTAFTTMKSKSKHGRSGDRIQIRTSELEIAAESASTKTSSDFQYPELDVSAFKGAYYISLYNFNNGYDNYDLYELYLE